MYKHFRGMTDLIQCRFCLLRGSPEVGKTCSYNEFETIETQTKEAQTKEAQTINHKQPNQTNRKHRQ